MTPFEPIALTIVTGFLGAGKTTLVNRLLRSPDLTDTAVIVNEFGEVAIDHLLVETSSDGIIQLADGCLCCSVRGELIDTLADLVDRLQTGRIPALKRVVVETTGLADPIPVLQSAMAHPVLVQAYRLDGVVTVVDAVNAGATLDAHAEAVRQVAVADRIVITKTDLADAAPLVERLRRLAPAARILDEMRDRPGPDALFGAGLFDPKTRTADVRRWLALDAPHDGHHHDGHDHHHDHDHHHHHHDDRIRSFSLVHDRPVAWSSIEMFLDLLRSTHAAGILRMKGVIELADDPERPVVLHGVQALLHPPIRLPAWPDGLRGTRLVLITMDLSEDYVRRLFAAFTGAPAVDRPDAAALGANPLAIPGMRLT